MNINQTYIKLLKEVFENGKEYTNERRGVTRRQVPKLSFRHDFSNGFPLIGIRKVSLKGIAAELLWFLNGDNNIKYLNQHGCKIWNDDAYNWYKKTTQDENIPAITKEEFNERGFGSVGRNYSVQWRDFNGNTDQIKNLIRDMKKDIMGSRLKVSAWNPSELDLTALPPCHTDFQIIGVPLENGTYGFELHWNQRSTDLFLGTPYNMASYALLALILEKITGFKALAVEGNLMCVHLYGNQIKPTAELLSRDFANLKNPFVTLPNTTAETIDGYLQEIEMNPEAFILSGYHPLDKLNVKMIAPK